MTMIAPRLVRLIQTHSEQLAQSLLKKVQNSPRLSEFCNNVPAHELRQRAFEIYRNLEDWLLAKTEADIEKRYTAIGARRAAQGVRLSQLILAIVTVKEHLWEFLLREGMAQAPVELYQELELLQLVDQFFDRAVCYAAIGHEQARRDLYAGGRAGPDLGGTLRKAG